MKRGAWCATVRRVTKRYIGWKRLGTHMAHLKGRPILYISSEKASSSEFRGSINYSTIEGITHFKHNETC